MRNKGALKMTAGLVAAVIFLALAACQNEKAVDPTKSLLMEKTQKLFTRIKVRDYAAIWENEFPYLREDSPREEYLQNDYMKWYKPDTLMAIQIDSATTWEDSAYVHMALEWLLSDSSFKTDTIRLRWHYSMEEWIKPTISTLNRQLEFEEELRMYWEAVEQMKKEEEEDSTE